MCLDIKILNENDEEIEFGEDDDDIVEAAKELGIELPAEKAKPDQEGEFNNFLSETEDGDVEEQELDDDMLDDEDLDMDLDFDVVNDMDSDDILSDEF